MRRLNFEKNGFYPSTQIQGRQLHKLERKIGCIARKLPFMYLGAPLFKGRCKAIYFDTLFQKFASCLDGWKTNFLSFAGKITLFKSVLVSLPVHILSCLAIPKQLINWMESLIRSFMWSQQGQALIHWVA